MGLHVYKDGVGGTLPNKQTFYLDKVGIEAANSKNIYTQFASKKEMPLQSGKEYIVPRWFRTYERELTDAEFAEKGFITARNIAKMDDVLVKATLAEGTTSKEGIELRRVNLSAKIAIYGEEIDYTDEMIDYSDVAVQYRFREELGQRANQLYEDLVQMDMLSTGNVLYTGLGTNLATMGQGLVADGSLDDDYRASYDFIRKCVRKLVRNQAKKNTEIVTGSTKIGSKPINEAYYAIVGPNVRYDLEKLTIGVVGHADELAFVPVYKYASSTNLAEGEVGAIHDVRIIESAEQFVYGAEGAEVPAGYTGTLSHSEDVNGVDKFDVFPILFPTKEAFATIGLKGKGKIEFSEQNPNQADSGNRFKTLGWVTYKMRYAGIILQEEKLLKALCLASN